jgi:hypothetical protein
MCWYRPCQRIYGLSATHICVAKGVSYCSGSGRIGSSHSATHTPCPSAAGRPPGCGQRLPGHPREPRARVHHAVTEPVGAPREHGRRHGHDPGPFTPTPTRHTWYAASLAAYHARPAGMSPPKWRNPCVPAWSGAKRQLEKQDVSAARTLVSYANSEPGTGLPRPKALANKWMQAQVAARHSGRERARAGAM